MAGWGPEFAQAAGEMYDWALLIVDAERAHVAPWDLAGVPETKGMPYWIDWIRATHYAVDELERVRAKRKK